MPSNRSRGESGGDRSAPRDLGVPVLQGRGIAVALKSQAVIWAVEAGFTSIRTHNAQSNGPMLAVNDRLGFVRDLAQIEFLKKL